MLENTFKIVYHGPGSAQGSLRPGNSATNPNHGFGLSVLPLPPNSEKRPNAECSEKQAIFTPKNLRQRFLDPENAGEAPWRVRSGVKGRRHGDNRLQSKIPFNYDRSSIIYDIAMNALLRIQKKKIAPCRVHAKN